eukprot:NODE_219_length_12440_cov_2.445588.p11 type:complete len:149 gc:universal NODE_219_length_12440_cov_2.445588:8509-8063(-)
MKIRQFQQTDTEPLVNLINKSLSEPYSIYTYRYFLHNWPELTWIINDDQNQMAGGLICRLESDRNRGYIAMLAVEPHYRRQGLAKKLVKHAILHFHKFDGVKEIVLETELSNKGAMKLYTSFGFIRDKYLQRYYMNGSDAVRLKLFLR